MSRGAGDGQSSAVIGSRATEQMADNERRQHQCQERQEAGCVHVKDDIPVERQDGASGADQYDAAGRQQVCRGPFADRRRCAIQDQTDCHGQEDRPADDPRDAHGRQ
jgi:hypothetical protein